MMRTKKMKKRKESLVPSALELPNPKPLSCPRSSLMYTGIRYRIVAHKEYEGRLWTQRK